MTWLLLLALAAQARGPCYPAELDRVVDGDTIDVRLQVRSETPALGVACVTEVYWRVRIADVRAPEMTGPERPDGERASAWLEVRLEGARAAARSDYCYSAACPPALEVCPRLDRKGLVVRHLGRLVADVKAGGADVGEVLIAAGLARRGTAEGW